MWRAELDQAGRAAGSPTTYGPASAAPSAPGDDVDEAAARVDQLQARPGRPRPRPRPPRPPRTRSTAAGGSSPSATAAITSTDEQAGQDEGEAADDRAGAAGDPLGACRSPSASLAGPGSRLQAANASSNSRGSIQPRRSTVRSRSSATWAGGPPKPSSADPAPLAGHGAQGGRRARAAYLAQWDGSSTCPTSRRLDPRHRRPPTCRSPRGCGRARSRSSSARRTCSGLDRAADRDPVRRAALDDPVRAAGHRQDDAGADARRVRRRGLRGALRGGGGPRRGARGDGAGPRAPPRRPPHDLLPRRDPPLQQGPAGRAAARGRGGPRGAGRRDDREPVLRGQLGADLAHAGLRAARADGGGHRRAAAAGAGRGRAHRSATR